MPPHPPPPPPVLPEGTSVASNLPDGMMHTHWQLEGRQCHNRQSGMNYDIFSLPGAWTQPGSHATCVSSPSTHNKVNGCHRQGETVSQIRIQKR